MKRDMDLIRRMLIEIEANDSCELTDVSEEIFAQHVPLLTEEQLIKGRVALESLNGPPGVQQTMAYVRLTSKGQDFLASIRDESVWNKTKAKVAEIGGTIAFSMLSALANKCLKEKLGLE